MSLPIPVPPAFRIIAHRGASAYAPENSMAAFALAQKMGIREIELDTQLTPDGVVALCHDRTLARYGHGAQAVEEMNWADLAALDMGAVVDRGDITRVRGCVCGVSDSDTGDFADQVQS